ncbi:MAG: endonuclease domain-containing protein [Anaerolineales bacterium]|nr:endonuclease domain-containing protein [Anaerolineales bacterium]
MPVKNIVTGQKVSGQKVERAREMRREMTPAERRLWGRLRANRLEGWHFRRQQVIDGFIVDFYCHQGELVVEVDGDVHAAQEEYDARRDEALRRRGLRVIRFTNRQVMNETERVLEAIWEALGPTPQPPSCRKGESSAGRKGEEA